MQITWKHSDTDLAWPLTVEQKIDIFYEQLRGWQLHVADLIANGGCPLDGGARVQSIPHSGFAVLQICLSYFETIGKYRALATGAHGAQFRAGAKAVLPELQNIPDEVREKLLDVLYGSARCGLYHNSRTSRGVGLGPTPNGQAMAYHPDEEILVISPHHLPHALKCHLERYRAELLDPINADARQCFERQFDEDFGVSPPPQKTSCTSPRTT
jgi:hypothetical protein